MPLVGLIEPGTVTRIFRSVGHARADVLLLLEQGQQSGHVLFEKGVPVTVRLDPLKGDDALAALEGWTSGHYSLLKRAQKEAEAKGHVLLNGLNLTTRRPLERWLKRNGWATSMVGYPQHARQVVAYIQPEVVLMHCPRHNLGLSCSQLSDELKADLPVAPLVVVLEDSEEHSCPQPEEGCVRIPGTVASLDRVLRQAWPKTALGARQAGEERTARVFRPEPTGVLRAVQATAAAEAPDEITARDLMPMLFTLLFGSGLIWTAWWVLNL